MAKVAKTQASAAIITIRQANSMTKLGRKAIAQWLRHHADMLEDYGQEYSSRFTGRYLYPTRD